MADAEGPTSRRGLLSRLRSRMPARAATATTSEGTEPGTPESEPSAEAEERWVLHTAGDGTGFEGWLYHYADGTMAAEDGTVYEYTQSGAVVDAMPEAPPGAPPEPEAEAEPEPEPEPEPASDEQAGIPSFIRYSPSELRTYALAAVVVVASIAAVITLFVVTPEPNPGGFVLVACLAGLAALAGWALSSWNPTVVSIRDGVLEVLRGEREDQFDLRDPDTSVVLGNQPGSPSWKAKVSRPDSPTVIIGARDVKARQFTRIVEHHRSRLRDPAGTDGDDRDRPVEEHHGIPHGQ